jgi:hypothetical protein
MEAPPRAPWTRRALVLASVALLTGFWLLVEAAGVDLPPLARHWPLYLLAGALASLFDYLMISRRPGALGLAVFGLVLGIDLYLVTLGRMPWRRVSAWGPALYLAVGLGCLAAWFADRRRTPRLLVIGTVAVGLAVTFWGWGQVPLALFWGLLLLLLGAALVALVVRGRRQANRTA